MIVRAPMRVFPERPRNVTVSVEPPTRSEIFNPAELPHVKPSRSAGEVAGSTYQRRWPLPLHSALVAQMLAKPMLASNGVFFARRAKNVRGR